MAEQHLQKANNVLKMMELDNSRSSASPHTTTRRRDMQRGHGADITSRVFLFPSSFDPYCMTELFSSLSRTGCTSKTCSTDPVKHSSFALHDSLCTRRGSCTCVNVSAMNRMRRKRRREIVFPTNPGSVRQPLSSLHYLPLLSF